MNDRRSSPARKGLLLVGILGISLLGLAGAILALSVRTEGAPAPSAQDRLALAKSAFAEGRALDAESHLQALAAPAMTDISTRLFRARVLLELGRISQARELYNAIHKEKPDTAEAVAGLGEAHERSGQLDLAIACYKRAAEMKKDDSRAFKLLGLAQVRSGDRMAALFSIRQSLKLLPGQEDLSRLLNDLGNARQARAGLPDQRSRSASFDPFEDFAPRGHDPRDLMPSPEIPDPLRGLPRPDGRLR